MDTDDDELLDCYYLWNLNKEIGIDGQVLAYRVVDQLVPHRV